MNQSYAPDRKERGKKIMEKNDVKVAKVTKFSTQIEKETKCIHLVADGTYEIEGPIDASAKIAMAIESVFHASCQSEEYLWMIALNVRNHPCGIFEVSHGDVNSSLAGPREVYMKALLVGASSIAIAHNHPSGDPHPSQPDLKTTKSLKEAGRLLGIRLIDHVIIGEDSYYSLKDHDQL